ncbi:MAG TPA: DUF4145 domain-containing protein [Solirubrobacteraceae bacterium]|nr:DUF4145 domain-containing protein [Solirubrobacteraceae bacterium]
MPEVLEAEARVFMDTDIVESPESQRTWPFICPHCEQASTALVCGKAFWPGSDDSPPVEWTMVQCDRCSEPTIQLREDYGGGFADDDHPATIYPAPTRLSTNIPSGLRRDWEEAQTCFRAKAHAACVVMVRRTLEGACADQGVKERTLAKNLKKLAEDGLVDETLAQWADALRIVGNRGAHSTGTEVPREDAEDALAFAEALLDHIYVLRMRFERFRKRLES